MKTYTHYDLYMYLPDRNIYVYMCVCMNKFGSQPLFEGNIKREEAKA